MRVGLCVSACARQAADPVDGLLSALESAAEARDADAFVARLSERFLGQDDLGKSDAHAALRRYFAAYESIALERHDLERTRQDGSARVRCTVAFTGTTRRAFGLENLLPPSALYRFDLTARDEGGTWRVSRAAWERIEGLPGP